MTYLAPRQGQFAMVLLLGFCLQVGVFIASGYATLKAQEARLAEARLASLKEELKTPLLVGDRISLSVIASRYESDPFVGYVGIYDSDGTLLVPAGLDDGQDGKQVSVDESGRRLGQVLIKPTKVSLGRVVSGHWAFLLVMLGFHVVLWMLYGYIARPSKALYDSIKSRTRQELLAAGVLDNTAKADPIDDSTKQADAMASGRTVAQDTPAPTDTALVVQLAYKDKDGLLSLLAEQEALRYFALCDELLQKTLKQLFATPAMAGVVLDQKTAFVAEGAFVSFIKKDAMVDDGKLVQVATTFANLFVLIAQTVYEKHRELSYFALPVKAVVCEATSLIHAKKLLAYHSAPCLVMLPTAKAKTLTQVVNIAPINDPKSVYERQSYVIGEPSPSLTSQLTRLRKQVLDDKNA